MRMRLGRMPPRALRSSATVCGFGRRLDLANVLGIISFLDRQKLLWL